MSETNEQKREREIREAIETFLKSWAELPTLIRAGCAASVAQVTQNMMNSDISRSRAYMMLGMSRRANVSSNFSKAEDAVISLFGTLANVADDEAVDFGVDKLGGTRLPGEDVHFAETTDD